MQLFPDDYELLTRGFEWIHFYNLFFSIGYEPICHTHPFCFDRYRIWIFSSYTVFLGLLLYVQISYEFYASSSPYLQKSERTISITSNTNTNFKLFSSGWDLFYIILSLWAYAHQSPIVYFHDCLLIRNEAIRKWNSHKFKSNLHGVVFNCFIISVTCANVGFHSQAMNYFIYPF